MPRAKKLTSAEKKADSAQRAGALIEEMLDQTETNPRPTLSQIEDMARDLRRQFGQALSESAIGS